MIDLNIKYSGIEKEIFNSQKLVNKVHDLIWEQNGRGHRMLGWLDWPMSYDQNELNLINKKIESWKKLNVEALLVIGIGGSYLGSKAGIDFLKGKLRSRNKIFFAGINISDSYILQLEEALADKKWGICVISKSGTTLEPGLAFRHFRNLLERQVGLSLSKKLIVCITDQKKGILKEIADQNDYQKFFIPKNIGGRFSVLTPVGLFPMAFMGIKINELLSGARRAREDFKEQDIKENLAYQYGVARFLFYKNNRIFEILTTYDPDHEMLAEWWKQLFGESEGKDGKGLFPFSVSYSKDLHSLGQIIQDGKKVFFETTIFNLEDKGLIFNSNMDNFDLLSYLNGRTWAKINKTALKGVLKAHAIEGGNPNLIITIPEATEEVLGYLWFFFFISVSTSAYLLGINPYDQPGVETYKKNMFISLRNKTENI